MNIYEKLQCMRVELQDMNIKKTGKNNYAGYSYYELGDFLPAINTLMNNHKVTSLVSFGSEKATLTLVNCEKTDEVIVFESPMEQATLKGAHPIQNLGAVETYSRRYLYMTAFEIVESDALDAIQGSEQNANNNKNNASSSKKQSTKQQPAKQQVAQLTEESKNALNTAIGNYVKLSGIDINQVMANLKRGIGKTAKEYTEADAKKALNLLETWQNEFMNEIGV